MISNRFFKRYSVLVILQKEDGTQYKLKVLATTKKRQVIVPENLSNYDIEEDLIFYIRSRDANKITKKDICTFISIEDYTNNTYEVKDKKRSVHINGRPQFYTIRLENSKSVTFDSSGITF